MILGWSPHATGRAGGVIGYLLDPVVQKTFLGVREDLIRDPAPELLAGDPHLVRGCIDALRTRCRYACATLSFAPDEIDLATWIGSNTGLRGQVAAAVHLFGEVAFAGIPGRVRPPVLVGSHLHTGRLEINILMPRTIPRRGDDGQLCPRSWNPRPPGPAGRDRWAAYVDTVNAAHGWADPGDPERAALVRGPSWVMKRAAAAERWIAIEDDIHGLPLQWEVRLEHEDPRVLILIAARRLAHGGATSSRGQLLDCLAPVLGRIGWQVEDVQYNRVGFAPVAARRGEGIVLTGRLFSADPTPDPAAGLAARHRRAEELRQAPERLHIETKRWSRYNKKVLGLGTWPTSDPAFPTDILASWGLPRPSPIQRLSGHLARLVSRLARHLQAAALRDRLATALRSVRGPDFASIATTLVELETYYARRQQHPPGITQYEPKPIEPGSEPDRYLPGFG